MKLRQVRFAARVHFLDACINAITFTDVGQTRGQTMVNGKLRHALPVASCTRLVRPAAATSLRTRYAGLGARHAHSIIEDEAWIAARRCCPKWACGAINEGPSHPSHAFLRHASAPRARAGVGRQRGPRLAGLRGARGGVGRARARRGSTWVRFSA